MLKKTIVVLNGFIHDFAAGFWLAALIAVALLHASHLDHPRAVDILNHLERLFFRGSLVAVAVILATGAGRTFTYVENWYGADTEQVRRRLLIVKHLVLCAFFGFGYLWVWGKVFHEAVQGKG